MKGSIQHGFEKLIQLWRQERTGGATVVGMRVHNLKEFLTEFDKGSRRRMEKGESKVCGKTNISEGTNDVVCFHSDVFVGSELDTHGLKATSARLFGWELDGRRFHLLKRTANNRSSTLGWLKDDGSRTQVQSSFDLGHVSAWIRIFVDWSVGGILSGAAERLCTASVG